MAAASALQTLDNFYAQPLRPMATVAAFFPPSSNAHCPARRGGETASPQISPLPTAVAHGRKKRRRDGGGEELRSFSEAGITAADSESAIHAESPALAAEPRLTPRPADIAEADSTSASRADDPGQLFALMLANSTAKMRTRCDHAPPLFRRPMMVEAFGPACPPPPAALSMFAPAGDGSVAGCSVAAPFFPPEMLPSPAPAHLPHQRMPFPNRLLARPQHPGSPGMAVAEMVASEALFGQWAHRVIAATSAGSLGCSGVGNLARRDVAAVSRGFSCAICRRSFPTVCALGGHKSMHRKHAGSGSNSSSGKRVSGSSSSGRNGASSGKHGGSSKRGCSGSRNKVSSCNLPNHQANPAVPSPLRSLKKCKVADDFSAQTGAAPQKPSISPLAEDAFPVTASLPTPPNTPSSVDTVPASWRVAGVAWEPLGESLSSHGLKGVACEGPQRAQLKRPIQERLLQSNLVLQTQDARATSCELPGLDISVDEARSPGTHHEGHSLVQDCSRKSIPSDACGAKFMAAAYRRVETDVASSVDSTACEELENEGGECPLGCLDLTLHL